MLSIGAMGSGQGSYYAGLAAEDYYLAGGEPPGQWIGQGAAILGLSGQVSNDEFFNLFSGLSAQGQPLVQNAGSKNRQPGWDLTFSAPKSVSTLWAIADEATRSAIQEAHFAALQEAVSFVEEGATTRRGKGGDTKEAAKLVVATFEHGTSRAQDPQLHTHVLVLNIGVRADGSTGSLESQSFYRSKMAAGALYRAELSRHLLGMGFEIEREKTTFEIAGVPPSLQEEFSKRRAEIEAKLAESGKSSARAAAFAALDTRQVKEHRARSDLFHEWGETGGKFGFTNTQAQNLKRFIPTRGAAVELPEALARGVEKMSAEQSHFGARDLIRAVAQEAQGRGLSAAQIRSGVRAQLDSQELVSLGAQRREARYTTRELWEKEKELLRGAEGLAKSKNHQVENRSFLFGLLKAEDRATRSARAQDNDAPSAQMNDEQREAVAHLTKESGALALVSGMAGTGKTWMLDAAREAWEAQGFKVRGAAVAGKAARGLQDGAGIESTTIARLVWEWEKNGRCNLDEKTVFVVDEAGMLGTRHMAALIAGAQQSGAKLVLVGDARQLQAVEVGGPFASLQARHGAAQLQRIVRQKEPWQREAVKDFAQGRAERALSAYAQRGCLHIANDHEGAKSALIEAWKGAGIGAPQRNVIFAGTRAEAQDLNRRAQSARRGAGKLGFRSLRVGSATLFEKDRVLFTKNNTLLGVQNGTTGTVIEVNPQTHTLTVKLDSGEKAMVSCRDYENLTLGYALTTHKGQGMTTENAFVLCGGAMTDRELSYVQASRARNKTQLFTGKITVWNPDTQGREEATLSELARQMSKSRQKDLAHDVMAPLASMQAVEPQVQKTSQAPLEPSLELEPTL